MMINTNVKVIEMLQLIKYNIYLLYKMYINDYLKKTNFELNALNCLTILIY